MDPSFDVIVCWINDKPTKFNKASIAEQFRLSKGSVVLGGIYDVIFKLPNGRTYKARPIAFVGEWVKYCSNSIS